jgi:hypothetical protein
MIDSFYTSMTLRLIRAGSRGEHEQKFLDEGRVYMAWEGLDVDLSLLADRQDLIRVLEERFPDEKAKALVNWSSQVWPFVKDMAQGNWVVMPSKLQSGLYFVNSPASTTSKRQGRILATTGAASIGSAGSSRARSSPRTCSIPSGHS